MFRASPSRARSNTTRAVMGFYCDSMGFYGDFLGFYCDSMILFGDLLDFFGDFMGYEWDVACGELRVCY